MLNPFPLSRMDCEAQTLPDFVCREGQMQRVKHTGTRHFRPFYVVGEAVAEDWKRGGRSRADLGQSTPPRESHQSGRKQNSSYHTVPAERRQLLHAPRLIHRYTELIRHLLDNLDLRKATEQYYRADHRHSTSTSFTKRKGPSLAMGIWQALPQSTPDLRREPPQRRSRGSSVFCNDSPQAGSC